MSRPKGISKTGGRSKGTPNKVTSEMKHWIQQLIDDNREQLEGDLMQLEPRERWQVIERLMNYCIPKQRSIDTDINLELLSDDQLNSVVNSLYKQIQGGTNE